MDITSFTYNVMGNVIAAIIITLAAKLLGSIWSGTRKLTADTAARLNKKLQQPPPHFLRKYDQAAADVMVISALLWMLTKTIEVSPATLSAGNVALIAAWTWALLTYVLHVWQRSLAARAQKDAMESKQ